MKCFKTLRLTILIACWLPAVCLATHRALATTSLEGRVTHVTLYRGQALVTREINVEGDAGSHEIVVGNLPEQITPASLFAEGNEQVEVRAVRFRSRAVGEQPREEIRRLDEELAELEQQRDLVQKQPQLLAQQTRYLDQLEKFVAVTANIELSRGVLDAEALERISKFSFEHRERIARKEVELKQQMQELNKQIGLVQRKRAELTQGAARTEREAVLFLQKHAAGNHADGGATVRLNYLVRSCGWSPIYAMRASADRKQVRVEYNALIHQLSGEDWADVVLTLSTASPTLSAARPGLAPFHVQLSAAVAANAPPGSSGGGGYGGVSSPLNADIDTDRSGKSKGAVQKEMKGLKSRRSKYAQQVGQIANFRENTALSWSMNDVASGLQRLELMADPDAMRILRDGSNDEGDGPSLSYQLTGTVSLASRSDQQMVRIMRTDLDSQFYHVATPLLTSYVFREAELRNDSDKDLLAGPMTVYLDDRFVGQGEISTVARGQTFVVGFGADPQLRARRELVEKEENVQGGNREIHFTYRLVIENFTEHPANVQLLDRVPHSERTEDIRVTLGEISDPLSEDKLYVRRERPMGLLRWEVDIPASAAGADARLIEYQVKVEYDRQFQITLPSNKQLQEDFERLQRSRQKR